MGLPSHPTDDDFNLNQKDERRERFEREQKKREEKRRRRVKDDYDED